MMHPGFGMGIEFAARTTDERAQVARFIGFLTSRPGMLPQLLITPRILAAGDHLQRARPAACARTRRPAARTAAQRRLTQPGRISAETPPATQLGRSHLGLKFGRFVFQRKRCTRIPKTPRGPHAVSRADPLAPGLFHLE